MDHKQRAREQWSKDPAGAVYGAQHEFGTREFFDEVERHRYQQYAPWMPAVMGFNDFAGKQLLEVGCGMGTDLLQFARGGAKVTGVDLTPRSIETSRHHLQLYGQTGEFAIADCERLPFEDESFDVAYSNGVLHHTPDTAQAVREIHRVLRAGGQARVMLYHRGSWAYWSQIILRYGILRREFLRGNSARDIMSKYVEVNTGGGRPLVKAYSRRELRKLFSMFREVKVQVEQLMRAELYFLSPLIPENLFRQIRKTVGWNLIVSARK
ncbi:MAG TPA: class I SAM-dependent methyltransferase [Pyrinomonadaceae bacterium]|jgi:ubiquinone/menaquinone biosynthesis C-methylase UbiE|nr:class I SAM-dependent methyltransferase [Pyrinomonadaceae bacterium]